MLAPLACYVCSLLVTVWGIQHNINIFKYPIYVLIPLVLAVYLPVSIVFLLPLDYITHNSTTKLLLLYLPDSVILTLWKGTYWTTFLLTWLILPLFQEYYRSGYFRHADRLKDAFKRNLRFQLVVLGFSVAGVLYLVVESGLSFYHIKLMIIALSHIYLLVLALWLMAHGLINIPRTLWTHGSALLNLNHHYLKVPRAVDNLEDTKISFKEQVLQVLVLTKNYTSLSLQDFQFRDWILLLYEKIPDEIRDSMERHYLSNSHNSITRDQLTLQMMTKLTASFNLNLLKLVAYESEFNGLFLTITRLEDIVGATGGSLTYRIPTSRLVLGPRARYVCQKYVLPVLSRLVSVVLFSVSFIILQLEFFHSTKMSLINTLVFASPLRQHGLIQFSVASLFFMYLLVSSLMSLTHLKIFNIYHLVPHNSDIVSACFYATYIARLTIPLSYNFITLFKSRESIFELWFGKSVHLTGLFNLLNNWLPRLILIPVLLTTFNVYERLKKRLGLNSDLYDSWAVFDDEEGADSENKRKDLVIVEAKRMIARETSRRNASINNEDNLRTFNLSQAANVNYETNRRNFNEQLERGSFDRTRIDEEETDFLGRPTSLWGRIGGAFTGLRSNIQQYRDDPEDDDLVL